MKHVSIIFKLIYIKPPATKSNTIKYCYFNLTSTDKIHFYPSFKKNPIFLLVSVDREILMQIHPVYNVEVITVI